MAGTDREAFGAAMGRVQALSHTRKLAIQLEEVLHGLGYRGPLAIHGSYLRDIALARDPSSISVALDVTFPIVIPNWPTFNGVPISFSADSRSDLVAHGYKPQLTNDAFNQETFLKAVLALEPLRINAIGATPSQSSNDPLWDWDAYYNRFVIRHGMQYEPERPEETLEALTGAKYKNWIIQHELADGDLSDGHPATLDRVLGLRDKRPPQGSH